MRVLPFACAFLIAVSAQAAPASRVRIVLKDSSNGDRAVGASPKEGIPAGHTLKVAVFGPRNSTAFLIVRQGAVELAEADGKLDHRGYGELFVVVKERWIGLVHAEVAAYRNGRGPTNGNGPGAQAEFRVIDVEPDPNVPEGWPVVFVMIGGLATLGWWRRARPETA